MYDLDPLIDFAAHDFEEQKELEELPRCDCCNEPLTDEFCYEINDEYICEKCMNEYFRKRADDI